MDKGRAIEKFVFDLTKTEGMTKEEKRAYYIKLFQVMERERLEKEVF